MLLYTSLALLAFVMPGDCQNITKTYGNSTTIWTSCGQSGNRTMECATIHVPMDHFSQKPGNKTFSIPLLRALSLNSDAKTILFNFGGPGAGGVKPIRTSASSFDLIYGDGFHFLGFDPRGTGGSRPLAKCEPEDAEISDDGKNPLGPLVPSQDVFTTFLTNSGDYYAAQQNFAKLCVETIGEHLGYMNTPQTAADMNDILHAIGEDKLYYQGYSYGTLLGAAYAQLFPDRVARMALDGIIDFEFYWNDIVSAAEIEADAVWHGLLEHCIKERLTCPLAEGFTTAEEINRNLTSQLNAMDLDPIGIYINSSAYGILRGSDIREAAIFARLYSPIRWPYLARSLTYLMRGDYLTPYLHFFGNVAPKNPMGKHSSISIVGRGSGSADDALDLITLADKIPADQGNRTKLLRKELLDSYVKVTSFMGEDFTGDSTVQAETWLIGRTHEFVPKRHFKTAHPVLLLSNVLDPVTPLRSARATNAVLQDSVLLVQNGVGHCTSSKLSTCTVGHLRKYFSEGVLPPIGTVCEVDEGYFPDPDLEVSKIMQPGSLESAKVQLAMHFDELAALHYRRQ